MLIILSVIACRQVKKIIFWYWVSTDLRAEIGHRIESGLKSRCFLCNKGSYRGNLVQEPV
jgi:hypothetical protein